MQTTFLVLLVVAAVRGRPSGDTGHVEENDEAVVRAAMVKATQGLNQTQADVVLSTLQQAHVSNTTISDPPFIMHQRSHRESHDNLQSRRNKEIRINEIKNRVLGYLERFGRRNASPPANRPLLHDSYSLTAPEVFAEKLQSFYPSCELPRNTDEELWVDGKSLNLMFEMNYPTPAEGSIATIIAAKLRLYKLSQGNLTIPREACPTVKNKKSGDMEMAEQADQAKQSEDTSTEVPRTAFETPVHSPEQLKENVHELLPQADQPPADHLDQVVKPEQTTGGEEDLQVRVSVYWYTRSLKKHRVKRKLLDSKMFSVFGDEWAEFNIRPAVRAWRDSRKNFGLVVEVEDEDGQLLDAAKYFSTMNCTNEASATAQPIPGFLVETARVLLLQNAAALQAEAGTDSAASLALNPIYLDAFLFPMIDMCTLELAKPKMLFEHPHYILNGERINSAEEGEDLTGELEKEDDHDNDHGHDHHHDHNQESNEDMPLAFLYNGHNSDHPHRHNHHHEVHNDSEQDNVDWTHDFRKHIINKTVILQAAHIKQALHSQRDKRRLL